MKKEYLKKYVEELKNSALKKVQFSFKSASYEDELEKIDYELRFIADLSDFICKISDVHYEGMDHFLVETNFKKGICTVYTLPEKI